jgi:ADP-heptose:LPS heptosyltransferase
MAEEAAVEGILVPSPPFRPGTRISHERFGFVYNCGGIGDYIHWTTAIRYAIETYPHTSGYIVTPPYFEDLARLWLTKYSDRFEILVSEEFDKDPRLEGIPLLAPVRNQYANASGFHLFALGYIYYNQISYIPAGYDTLPRIEGDEAPLEHFSLPESYVVVTTEATAENRRLPARVVNEITKSLIATGITPVFLGKKELAADYKSDSNEGISLRGVLDLREKTSLREAACVLARAKAVVGLDNGLIHLACCSDVPVLAVFTTVDPGTRIPKRKDGAKTVILTPDESLACRFCQTRVRFVFGFDSKYCLYKDNLCVKGLDGRAIVRAMREMMK